MIDIIQNNFDLVNKKNNDKLTIKIWALIEEIIEWVNLTKIKSISGYLAQFVCFNYLLIHICYCFAYSPMHCSPFCVVIQIFGVLFCIF